MLAHASHAYTTSDDPRLESAGHRPSEDLATRPRSLDPSLHPSEETGFSPQTNETVDASAVPSSHHRQFQKSHASAHRLVHPCMVPASYPTYEAEGMVHRGAHAVVYPFASSNMAVPTTPRNHRGGGEDIESGLGSGSLSSGRSSTSSLVRGAGESVLAGIDWAGGKLAHLFGVAQPKYQWAIDEYDNQCKQAELDRLARSARFFEP